MLVYLINPGNPLASISSRTRWARYRIWKPLGLMVLAAVTPGDWRVRLIDENVGAPDYDALPRPDLVGLTAFTAQANRAYQLAAMFRRSGVPVVMGGIHATMCAQEASRHVDSIVTGEAEHVWPHVLADAAEGVLRPRYDGGFVDLATVPAARHDLLPKRYAFGSVQTTRGCPLNCHFCSVSAFNGHRYRHRPIPAVIDELKRVPERYVLVVDDNLIGTRTEHTDRAKELFRAMIAADLGKRWIAQTTLNFGEDDQLMDLAAKAGCMGVFIGFESPDTAGLRELGKGFNIVRGKDIRGAVARIHKRRIAVVGSFIMGLDTDTPGVGRRIARTATTYGVDVLSAIFLTPLPGTRLWDKMESEGRIAANYFPQDWRYYTLGFPVASYRRFTWSQMIAEMDECYREFYSARRIAGRLAADVLEHRMPGVMLLVNLSYRANYRGDLRTYREYDLSRGGVDRPRPASPVTNQPVPVLAAM